MSRRSQTYKSTQPHPQTRRSKTSSGTAAAAPPPPRGQRHTHTHTARVVSDDEDDDDDAEAEGEGGEGEEGGGGGGDQMDVDVDGSQGVDAEITRKANQLARLALFNEHRRMPLRREEISKKVLANNPRVFGRVFDNAQAILRNTFGMEMVELQSRAALDKDMMSGGGGGGGAEDEELDEAKRAIGLKKKATAAGSKTYILRSTLDPTLIELASLVDQKILNAELEDAFPADADDEEDDEETVKTRCYGSILSWSATDHPVPIGILYVILSLILVSGRVIGDSDLRTHLRRLHLPTQTQIPFLPHTTQRSMNIDTYLGILQRQGYIDRTIVGDTGTKSKAGKGGSAKRARASGAGGQDDEGGTGVKYEWRWGPRGQSEVGEKGIARFVAEFMVGVDEDEGEGDEQGAGGGAGGSGSGSRGGGGGGTDGEKRRKKVEKVEAGIEKAAGGAINGLK